MPESGRTRCVFQSWEETSFLQINTHGPSRHEAMPDFDYFLVVHIGTAKVTPSNHSGLTRPLIGEPH